MGFRDIILFPIYVYLFHLLFSFRRKKIQDPLLKKYHLLGFWVKVFATIAISIFNVYISIGDSVTLYFPEGLNIYKLILQDASHIKWLFMTGKNFDTTLIANPFTEGYFGSEANFFVIRLVAIFSFIGLGSYSVVNLFFSMIAFSGIWKLFKFFYGLYPKLHRQFAIAILFFPTVVFWSSGILKDPICMGALGWLTYSINQAIYKKTNVGTNLLIAILSGWTLAIVKPYILYAYLPFFLLYLVFANLYLIKSIFLKTLIFLLIGCFTVAGFIFVSERLQEEMGAFALEKIAGSIKTQQTNFANMADQAESSFSLGIEYDGSVTSLLKIAPAAINATLFRPYLWESKKISTLLSSIESLTLMFFTLFVFIKAGPVFYLKTIFNTPVVMYCFFFSIMFALFIGATTLNFGTLVRYKIPCMPFYVIAHILIYHKRMLLQKKTAQKGTL